MLRNQPSDLKSLSDTPKILILAGPNGAGKTTFAREFVRKELGFKHFVNADLIAAGMSPFEPELAAIAAGRVMLDHITHLVKAKESFVIETTLSGLGYARHIRSWRISGYKTSLIFLSLSSASIAIERVKNRVKQGGHNIPIDVIKRRYIAGIENFNTIYKDLVDDWQVLDNTDSEPIPIDWKGKIMPKSAPIYPEHVKIIIQALKRARKLARKVSQETRTPLIYMKDGKIIKEMITKP